MEPFLRRLECGGNFNMPLLFFAALIVPVSFRLALWSESTVLVSAADLLGLYVDLCMTCVWVLLVVLAGSNRAGRLIR